MSTLLDILIETMEEVENNLERFDKLSGQAKKEEVLYIMEQYIVSAYGESMWEKWQPVLPILIDFIVKISKNQVILRINEQATRFCRDRCF